MRGQLFADVASHQKTIDMGAYRNGPQLIDRIMIKATEGVSYRNPRFKPQWYDAWSTWLRRGAYHFARPSRNNAYTEAEFFVDTVEKAGADVFGFRPGVDWLCLDLEDTELGDASKWVAARAWAISFCERMVSLGYPTGSIYSGRWYLEPTRLQAAHLPEGWRTLHISDYTNAEDDKVRLPPGWSRNQVIARQYTETGRWPGISTNVDLNRVVNEWGQIGELDDMDINDIKGAVRDVLNEATSEGKTSFAETIRAICTIVEKDVNWNARAMDILTATQSSIGLVGLAVAEVRNFVDAINRTITETGASPDLAIDYQAFAAALVNALVQPTARSASVLVPPAATSPAPNAPTATAAAPIGFTTTEAFGRTWVDVPPEGSGLPTPDFSVDPYGYLPAAPLMNPRAEAQVDQTQVIDRASVPEATAPEASPSSALLDPLTGPIPTGPAPTDIPRVAPLDPTRVIPTDQIPGAQ